MPPIRLDPIGYGIRALFFHFLFFFFCYHSLQNRFFALFFSVWHETITYSLLFMFDGIFKLNGCNLTHKEIKICVLLDKSALA